MSTSIAKNMSKNELKSMLMKMGTSLDKDDHPKSYYEKLYLEKMNAKNKRTRSNNIFGREQILNSKRERTDTKDKKDEDEDDEDYVVEEEEEENSHQENEEINDDENLYANSEESDQDTEGKKKKSELKLKYKKMATKELVEKNKNYKEVGIKYTRLIPMKKKKTEERKKLFVIHEGNNNKNIIHNNNIKQEEIIREESESDSQQYEKDNNKVNALKSSKKPEQNINIENNEFHQVKQGIEKTPDNKKDISLTVNENYTSGKSPQSKKQIILNSDANPISFGAPKTYEKNNFISLSKGPISFGFNQSANSNNLENSEYKPDNTQSDIKSKKYGIFVQKISEAVRDSMKDSQNMENNKAKTILLKWESPRQKEFLSHSMEKNNMENNGNDINDINVEYNFNERINNIEDENPKLKKGHVKKSNGYSSKNNYMQLNEDENIEKNKNKILTNEDGDNEYKYKLRSYDKNKKKLNAEMEVKDNDNENKEIIENPFYTNTEQKNLAEGNYIENHDIYGNSKEMDLNPNNEYYYNNNANKNNNMEFEENNQYGEENLKNNNRKNYLQNNYQFATPNNNAANDTNINNNYYRTLEDQIKYDNRNQNINFNAENARQNNLFDEEIAMNNQQKEQKVQQKRKSRFLNKISGMKNSVMYKFKHNVFLLPLLLLILFGIVYFLNNSYERFENVNIIIVFSILMGLLILYHLFKYFKTLLNYIKMAKADRFALLYRLINENITRDSLANNMMLINNFINERIELHQINHDEYMKYVFHYLKKDLKKDGFNLNIGEENNQEFWKEI